MKGTPPCCSGETGAELVQRKELIFPSTLNCPVYKESPWAVSDFVEPAIVTVLQDPQEKECPQSEERTYLTSIHINQDIIH